MSYLISIEESIKDILLTPLGTRLMRPDYGSRLHELVDKRIDDAWRAKAAQYIIEAISKNEPRVQITRAHIEPKGHKVRISLVCKSGKKLEFDI